MTETIIALILSCSSIEVKDAECRVGCQWAGYDSGCYSKKHVKCLCTDMKDYERVTRSKNLRVPNKFKKSETIGPLLEPSPYYY